MADFRKLVAVSLLAGSLAGLLLSILQYYQTLPLLLEAEQFEMADPQHMHDWQPQDGWQRNLFTVLFNSLAGFGFGLLLTVAMYWQGSSNYLRGLLWGLAGYLVFFVAPALGLPPELPGADSAELHDRQVWWLFTASATAAGLYGLVSNQGKWLKIVGVLVLITPHLIGAPHPEIAHTTAPQELQERFILFSAISNALFWLALGGLAGWLLPRFKL